MRNYKIKVFGIICAVIINIFLIVAVVVSIVNTISDLNVKKEKGLLIIGETQNSEEKEEVDEENVQQEQDIDNEMNFSPIEFIQNLGVDLQDIIKIILIVIAIILFNLGIYILAKIR